MKRKLVKHGQSTLIVSLPSKWVKEQGLSAGDDLIMEDCGDHLELCKNGSLEEEVSMDITGLDAMIPRYIFAQYKKGADVLHLSYQDQHDYDLVKSSLGHETVGYEIVEHNVHSCVVKNVGVEFGAFDLILKKTLLLLYTQGSEILEAMRAKDRTKLTITLDYEKTNNTFTTICRRYLNKKSAIPYNKIGPLYYIVEDLENVADHFKYIVTYLLEKKSIEISESVLAYFEEVNTYINRFFELYFRFENEHISKMQDERKRLMKKGTELIETCQGQDAIVVHHLMIIMQKIFCLIGPYMINAV